MGSDKARNSYDVSRRYDRVVEQQGRVHLEADHNEAYTIIGETIRNETLDIVGPTGSPDDGYKIDHLSNYDFDIEAGTIYVGGMRVTLPATTPPLTYSAQATGEWLDFTGDPLWLDSTVASPKNHELAYLLLREQEVSAVEDTALLEVALGGPDTAQRLRLIPRVVRFDTNQDKCDAALTELTADFATKGLAFDPTTMRLESGARLKADFTDPPTNAGPCEPNGHGGYLEADNQLIRIQITSPTTFVWGFDNASFLYRVRLPDLATLDFKTLELLSAPVDADRAPATGQYVEILRSAVALGGDDYVAAHTGQVRALARGYESDKTVILTADVPTECQTPVTATTPPLFMRVWQSEVTFTPGTAIPLGDTGLQVTITNTASAFNVGDYWMIAVRPTTPAKVYPQRYLDSPQPPEGPRLWMTPLALVTWASLEALDCRQPFDNLVELTKRKTSEGCCTYTVGDGKTSHGDFETIQAAVDEAQNRPVTGGSREPARICILPGTHELEKPVVLSEASDLTISGCGAQTLIIGRESVFAIMRSSRITLEGLTMRCKEAKTPTLAILGSGSIVVRDCEITNNDGKAPNAPAVYVLPVDASARTDLLIERCDLTGSPPIALSARGVRITNNQMHGGGVWVGSLSDDVLIRDNRISGVEGAESGWPGVLLGGSMSKSDILISGDAEERLSFKPTEGFNVSRVEVVGNRIEGLLATGIACRASDNPTLLSDIKITHNQIVECATSQTPQLFGQLAVGGIVLKEAKSVLLHSNEIRGNGSAGKPTCGIFLDGCFAVQIVANTVLANSGTDKPTGAGLFQGGIIVINASPDRDPKVAEPPAAFVHDNIVVAPRGQSLLVDAIGPVSVTDNSLTSQNVADQPGLGDANAGRGVFIRNFGMPLEDELFKAMFTKFNQLLAPKVKVLEEGRSALPDGRVLVSGNQISTSVGDKIDAADAAVAVLALDDVCLDGNQVRVDVPGTLRMNVAAVGLTVRASGNRFAEPRNTNQDQPVFSYLSQAPANIAIGNQATNCMLILGGVQPIDEHNQRLYHNDNCEEVSRKLTEKGPAVGYAASANMAPYATMLNTMNADAVKGRLQALADASTARVDEVASAIERLKSGGGDPAVVASLQTELAAISDRRDALVATAANIIPTPTIEEGEGVVHGRVTDPTGKPISGVPVLVAPEGADPQSERSATTNADGEFEIRYSPAEIKNMGDAASNLSLSVRQSTRTTLKSDEAIDIAKTGVEYFQVVLPPAKAKPQDG